MNIAVNPWSFTSADVPASSTPVASPNGLVQQGSAPGEKALGAVLLTTTAAHGLLANQFVTIIGTTGGRFLGFYRVVAVPSATTALLANISSPTSGQPFNTVLAGDGGGTVLVNQVQQNVRIEDISIQSTQIGAIAGLLLFLDRNGFVIWEARIDTSGAAAVGTSPLAQNRGKIMWVDGLTLQSMPAGVIALLTIN